MKVLSKRKEAINVYNDSEFVSYINLKKQFQLNGLCSGNERSLHQQTFHLGNLTRLDDAQLSSQRTKKHRQCLLDLTRVFQAVQF